MGEVWVCILYVHTQHILFYKKNIPKNFTKIKELPSLNKEMLDKLNELLSIQGTEGNWNNDSYMTGMYNGMELMLSIVEGREVQYRSIAPSANISITHKEHADLLEYKSMYEGLCK